MKKLISCLVLAAMMCGCLASCGDDDTSDTKKDTDDKEVVTEAPTEAEEATEAPADEEKATEADAEEATEAPAEGEDGEEDEAPPQAVVTDDVEFEEAVEAQSGDAFLYINEEQNWIQYDGKMASMLAYDAGVPHIEGNGKYTVSVTSDTNGFRYDTTGDASDDSAVPSGLMFSAVIIKDGTTLFPDAVITIDEIRVNGKAITLTAKNYTSSDDGKELRSNIYNKWVNALPGDARSTEGALADENGKLLDIAADYSPQIVDLADFGEWTTVEVDFTISGIAE